MTLETAKAQCWAYMKLNDYGKVFIGIASVTVLGVVVTSQLINSTSKNDDDVYEAISKGNIKLLKKILEQNGDIERNQSVVQTPLTATFFWWRSIGERGHEFTPEESREIEQRISDMVELLLRHGANVNQCNRRHESPLYLAIIWNRYSVADLLLENGAEVNLLVTDERQPLLYYALIWDECYTGQSYLDMLLDNGADINIQNDNGDSLLHLAVEFSDDPDRINRLLEKSIDVKLENNQGQTALELCLGKNKREKCHELLRSYLKTH